MNINLKLKQRREKINQILRHKRTKVMRKFKQVKNEVREEESHNSNDLLKNKIEKYLKVEKMIEKYDMKMGGREFKEEKSNIREKTKTKTKINDTQKEEKEETKNVSKNQNNFNQKQGNNKFLNIKRERKSPEEIETEKLEKSNKRKASYKKLNKKTPKGQPVMKYQVEHIFRKIKDKINKGQF